MVPRVGIVGAPPGGGSHPAAAAAKLWCGLSTLAARLIDLGKRWRATRESATIATE